MKHITDYILESVNEIDQLRKDCETAGYATGQEKKDLMAKYNVESKKSKDIIHAILIKLQELRKDKKEFSVEDVNDFSRLSENDTQYYAELKKENDDFVKYLLEYWENRIKKQGRDLYKYINLTSFSNYNFSSAEKWFIKRYQKIREELMSRDPKNIKAKEKEEYSIDTLVTKLGSELEEFKKIYLKRVEDNAKDLYEHLPNEIIQMTARLKKMEEDYDKKKNEVKGYTARWNLYKPIEKYANQLSQKKAILKRYTTAKEFITACLDDAEKTFKGNVEALAHRVYEKKFDVDKIKVSNVKDDPKIFKLMIEDDTKKLYCRSILAAQFSSKMTPHFRFIMTDRK